jgi:hypothetical protein
MLLSANILIWLPHHFVCGCLQKVCEWLVERFLAVTTTIARRPNIFVKELKSDWFPFFFFMRITKTLSFFFCRKASKRFSQECGPFPGATDPFDLPFRPLLPVGHLVTGMFNEKM